MSTLVYIIGAAVMVILAVIAWIAREELKQIGLQFLTIASILWTIWCWTYTIRWRLRFLLRNFLVQTALGVLLVAGFYVFLELAIAVFRHVAVISPNPGDKPRLALFPEVPTPPLPLEAVLLILAVLLVRHHWQEWRIRKRESAVPRGLEEMLILFDEFRKANVSPASTKAFLEALLDRFKSMLEIGNKKGVAISLMEDLNGILAVTFIHPADAQLDKDLKLALGEGGAGKAYKKKVPIYIPSVRHLVGINIATMKPEGVTFKPSQHKERFRSLLCVPILTKSKVIGVLSFSSQKRAAFFPLDFEIASLAAAFVAMFY